MNNAKMTATTILNLHLSGLPQVIPTQKTIAGISRLEMSKPNIHQPCMMLGNTTANKEAAITMDRNSVVNCAKAWGFCWNICAKGVVKTEKIVNHNTRRECLRMGCVDGVLIS